MYKNFDSLVNTVKIPKENPLLKEYKQDENEDPYEKNNPNLKWKTINFDIVLSSNRHKELENPITEYSDKLTEKDLPNCRQDSEAWLRMRDGHGSNDSEFFKKRIIGGSDLGNLLGLFSPWIFKKLKKAPFGTKEEFRRNFYNVLHKLRKEFKKEDTFKLDWGKVHEKNGIAAFLQKHFNFTTKESGSYFIPTDDDCNHHYLVSPDAFYVTDNGEEGCIEIKNSFPFIIKSDKEKAKYMCKHPWKEIPWYNIPQPFLQMKGTGKKKNCVINHTPTKGTGFYWIEYDDDYMKLIFKTIKWALKNLMSLKIKEIPDNPFEKCSWYNDFLEETIKKTKEFKYEFIDENCLDNLYYKGKEYSMFYGPPLEFEKKKKEKNEENKKARKKKDDDNPKPKKKKKNETKEINQDIKNFISEKKTKKIIEIIEINSGDETP